ncbi:MucBP domain-containing protein [Xylanimonas allomyrinae]|uniref:MucBP domain-containing protein n=1 Tax=Xylanimonas allomyrinae TaxID=2509459 RepID=UPI0013A60BC6|nr:MucBP domain-containing protein [Xylanimonas allomyrinae]
MRETRTPTGYNPLPDDFEVAVGADGVASIVANVESAQTGAALVTVGDAGDTDGELVVTNEKPRADVVVNWVDSNGDPLRESSKTTQDVGSGYDSYFGKSGPPTFPGYVLWDQTGDTPAGTVDDDGVEVTYVYVPVTDPRLPMSGGAGTRDQVLLGLLVAVGGASAAWAVRRRQLALTKEV